MEVEERRKFLDDMIALGKGKEYKPIILAEISQVYIFKILKSFI